MDVSTRIQTNRARPHGGDTRRHIARSVAAAAVLAAAVLLSPPVPAASAQPCPDVEVVFARGSGEPAGVGGVGQAFVDAVTSQVGGRSVGVYPVNYAAAIPLPPSAEYADRLEFARTFVDGVKDAGAHVMSTAANCPNTRMVLGGYSQGAALAGYVTSAAIPPEVPAAAIPYLPKPMPMEVANHVAAVTLFGRPSNQFLTENGAPPVVIGPAYAPKTIDLCAPDDTICNGTPGGQPSIAHALYQVNGMTGQAADFAASRL